MYATSAIIVLSLIFKNFVAESSQYDVDTVLKVIEEFDVKHPNILASGNGLHLKWIKILSNRSQYSGKLKYKKKSVTEKEGFMIFVDEHNFADINEFLSISKSTTIVISRGIYLERVLSESKLEINQPIYFYNQDNHEVMESYTINDYNIHRKIGRITRNGFQWTMNSNFLHRRSDFHGLTLNVMVEWAALDMNADDSYLSSAPYFSGISLFTLGGRFLPRAIESDSLGDFWGETYFRSTPY